MKKYIVTGGAGFIGSHLTDELISQGHDVIVVDNLSSGYKENIHSKAVFQHIDILDKDALKKAFAGADGVFHMAAIVSVQYSLEHPEETYEINVTGTKNVVEAARANGIKKVVFSSSAAVYGDYDGGDPIDESFPLNPKSPYGEHKMLGEKIADFSLRYFNVYGNRQRADSPYAGVIAQFMKKHREGKALTLFGDGSQTRDFVSVLDVVDANIKAMESIIQKDVVNIGSGVSVSIKEIAEILGGEIQYLPARIEPKNSKANISKAKKLLTWAPRQELRYFLKSI
jgi:UDP-glucose 4-epimerase